MFSALNTKFSVLKSYLFIEILNYINFRKCLQWLYNNDGIWWLKVAVVNIHLFINYSQPVFVLYDVQTNLG